MWNKRKSRNARNSDDVDSFTWHSTETLNELSSVRRLIGRKSLGKAKLHENSSGEGSSTIRVPMQVDIATLQPYYLEIGGMKHVRPRTHAMRHPDSIVQW